MLPTKLETKMLISRVQMHPGPFFFFQMSKKIKKNCYLCHIQMRPAKLETKMLIILACAKKKNKSKTKCHPKFVFFTDETPLLRSA